jgi:ribulose-phosphate 3-epimerase
MAVELSASMMCADFSSLKEEVIKLEKAGVDAFHIDIMDGNFVDNFGMGYQDMKIIRNNTKKKLDVHLMVSYPYNYLELLHGLSVDVIYVHPEVVADCATIIEKIKEMGIEAGIALTPGTSLGFVEELLNVSDRVLVLGVNPGHSGRTYQNYVDNKIEKLLAVQNRKFKIILDGAVTKDRIKKWGNLGVDGFILGTATLFGKKEEFSKIIQEIRRL